MAKSVELDLNYVYDIARWAEIQKAAFKSLEHSIPADQLEDVAVAKTGMTGVGTPTLTVTYDKNELSLDEARFSMLMQRYKGLQIIYLQPVVVDVELPFAEKNQPMEQILAFHIRRILPGAKVHFFYYVKVMKVTLQAGTGKSGALQEYLKGHFPTLGEIIVEDDK